MKVLIVPDSFKGSLSSFDVINIITEVLDRNVENCEIIGIPVADGGEGTIEAILKSTGGDKIFCEVLDPIGRTVKAYYGITQNTIVIEMAQASGLTRLDKYEYDVAKASTYGTGELMKHALDKERAKAFIIGIGGSATNDGGTGFAKALGVMFYDVNNQLIEEEGAQILGRIARIDISDMDARLAGRKLTVMCDVVNPLTGKNGATAVYGAQKGLESNHFEAVEAGMENYRKVLLLTTGIDVNDIPGSGAAGGLGATLVALFGATLKAGIDTFLDLVEFDNKLVGVDYVITGEGRIDGQTAAGKVPVGVARRCKVLKNSANKPIVIAVAGCDGSGFEEVYAFGIDRILTTVPSGTSTEYAMRHAKDNLKKTAEKLAAIINGGTDENLD